MKLFRAEVGECGGIYVHADTEYEVVQMIKADERFNGWNISIEEIHEVTEKSVIIEAGFGE